MKKNIFAVLLIVVMLAGCSALKNQKKEYVGNYSYGADVNTFTDENTKQVYWVIGEEKVLNELKEKVEKIRTETSNPYPELRIKAVAEDKGEAANGLAEEGDRAIEIREYQVLEK